MIKEFFWSALAFHMLIVTFDYKEKHVAWKHCLFLFTEEMSYSFLAEIPSKVVTFSFRWIGLTCNAIPICSCMKKGIQELFHYQLALYTTISTSNIINYKT